MNKSNITGLFKVAILAVLLFSFYTSCGQSFFNKKYAHKLIFHAGTGTSHYFGDLVDNGYITLDGNFTAGIRYPVGDRISLSADGTWFRLHAKDINSHIKGPRNLSFFSNNVEIAGTVQVDLFQEPMRFYKRKTFNPYLFGGAGILLFGPRTRYNGQVYALRPLETEGKKYNAYTWSFPFGGGLRYKLNAFVNLTVEAGFRYTLTDYLDDVSSGVFLDPTSFTDPIARALADRSGEGGMNPTMSQIHRNVRGNPKKKDAYALMLLRIEYYMSPIRDSFKAIMYQGRKAKMRRGRR